MLDVGESDAPISFEYWATRVWTWGIGHVVSGEEIGGQVSVIDLGFSTCPNR